MFIPSAEFPKPDFFAVMQTILVKKKKKKKKKKKERSKVSESRWFSLNARKWIIQTNISKCFNIPSGEFPEPDFFRVMQTI